MTHSHVKKISPQAPHQENCMPLQIDMTHSPKYCRITRPQRKGFWAYSNQEKDEYNRKTISIDRLLRPKPHMCTMTWPAST